MQYVWRALLALFLLYHELFSDHELFTDCDLHDARTEENFTMLPDAALLLHPFETVPRMLHLVVAGSCMQTLSPYLKTSWLIYLFCWP